MFASKLTSTRQGSATGEQTAAKVRGFSPIASGFTAETDWLLEQAGFELYVPPPHSPADRRLGTHLTFRPGKFIAPVEALAAASVPQSSNAETPIVRVGELGGQISGIA